MPRLDPISAICRTCIVVLALGSLVPDTRAQIPSGPPRAMAADPGTLPVRGIVRALHQAQIATDLSLKVARINVREAQSFKAGDELLIFDCERMEAEQVAARAQYSEAKLALESNLYLDGKGAVGRYDVEITRVRVQRAGAEVAALRARLKQCRVVAPFAGRVANLSINEYEMPAVGKPFISLVATSAFEIDLIVPSGWLRHIAPGAAFRFRLDETGKTLDAEVKRIGAAVDPVSQTIKLIAAFSQLDDSILAGMSGTAMFSIKDDIR